jgi:hypothetical protein
MIVKLLEDNSLYGLKEGQVMNIPDEIARELISKGGAMKENTTDKEAHDALFTAKVRDQAQQPLTDRGEL